METSVLCPFTRTYFCPVIKSDLWIKFMFTWEELVKTTKMQEDILWWFGAQKTSKMHSTVDRSDNEGTAIQRRAVCQSNAEIKEVPSLTSHSGSLYRLVQVMCCQQQPSALLWEECYSVWPFGPGQMSCLDFGPDHRGETLQPQEPPDLLRRQQCIKQHQEKVLPACK